MMSAPAAGNTVKSLTPIPATAIADYNNSQVLGKVTPGPTDAEIAEFDAKFAQHVADLTPNQTFDESELDEDSVSDTLAFNSIEELEARLSDIEKRIAVHNSRAPYRI